MLSNAKAYIIKNKYAILFPVLVTLGFIIVLSFRGTQQKTLSNTQNANFTASSDTPFLDSLDWKKIDKFNITSVDKIKIKTAVLKVTIDTGIINGNPPMIPTSPLASYLPFIDKFYQDPNNQDIPVALALKAADMSKSGLPNSAIESYNKALMKKLKQAQLIK